uniref:Uncharacterized protein n=1 Tax=Vespula pensylvanica TaxID=30213 RepID=A0A834NT31_VESPE|nr:hypothetical protein H0235_011765 [Vespula pensylvanica]
MEYVNSNATSTTTEPSIRYGTYANAFPRPTVYPTSEVGAGWREVRVVIEDEDEEEEEEGEKKISNNNNDNNDNVDDDDDDNDGDDDDDDDDDDDSNDKSADG